MKRHNNNNIDESLTFDSPSRRRKRPLSSSSNNNNTMCSPPPPTLYRSHSRSPSRSSIKPSSLSTTFQMRGMLYMLVVITLSSSVFCMVRYHATLTENYHGGEAIILPGVRKRRRTTQQVYERRKRPPTVDSSSGVSLPPVEYHLHQDSSLNSTMKHWKTLDSKTFCGEFAKQAASNHGYMYSPPLDQEAVVLISGILEPLGVALALRLHLECGVVHIVGVDSLLPNLRHSRVKRMHSYAFLQKYIPNLPRLIVPELGLPLLELHQKYKLTHVVHLANQYPTSLESTVVFQQLQEELLEMKQENTGIKAPHLTYVSTANNNMTSRSLDLLALTYHNVHGTTTSSTVGLRLPHVFGEYEEDSVVSNMLMQHLNNNDELTTNATTQQHDEQVLYLDDAVDAIVAAMQIQPPTGLATFDVSCGISVNMLKHSIKSVVSKQNTTTTTSTESMATKETAENTTRHWLGWIPATSLQEGTSKVLSLHLAHKYPYGSVEQTLAVPTPPQRVLFPCASECARPSDCASTMFDDVIKISRPLTRGCKYLIYAVDLWSDMDDLPSSGEQSSDPKENAKWCRIAFVSSKSPLVKEVIAAAANSNSTTNITTIDDDDKNILDRFNGKVQWKNWTLVFVDGDAANMSEAEYTLLKLSPKRFFSETVSRAMFVQLNRFPVPPYESLAGYFKSLDPSAKSAGRTKEYRSGVNIFRFLPKAAKKARRVLLSSLEASFPNVPEKSPIGVHVQDLIQREGIKPNQERLKPQLSLYTYAAHFVQNGVRRPQYEMQSTVYRDGFPFHWLKTAMIVHDLREDESRNLRCEWYDEHLFWGNSHLEDVSLAYVLAKRRIMGRHDVSPEKEEGWFPIMNTEEWNPDEQEFPERLTNADDTELFVRILPKPKS